MFLLLSRDFSSLLINPFNFTSYSFAILWWWCDGDYDDDDDDDDGDDDYDDYDDYDDNDGDDGDYYNDDFDDGDEIMMMMMVMMIIHLHLHLVCNSLSLGENLSKSQRSQNIPATRIYSFLIFQLSSST